MLCPVFLSHVHSARDPHIGGGACMAAVGINTGKLFTFDTRFGENNLESRRLAGNDDLTSPLSGEIPFRIINRNR